MMICFLRLFIFPAGNSGPPIICSCHRQSVFGYCHRVRPVVTPIKDGMFFSIFLETPLAGKVVESACAIGSYCIDTVRHKW